MFLPAYLMRITKWERSDRKIRKRPCGKQERKHWKSRKPWNSASYGKRSFYRTKCGGSCIWDMFKNNVSGKISSGIRKSSIKHRTKLERLFMGKRNIRRSSSYYRWNSKRQGCKACGNFYKGFCSSEKEKNFFRHGSFIQRQRKIPQAVWKCGTFNPWKVRCFGIFKKAWRRNFCCWQEQSVRQRKSAFSIFLRNIWRRGHDAECLQQSVYWE